MKVAQRPSFCESPTGENLFDDARIRALRCEFFTDLDAERHDESPRVVRRERRAGKFSETFEADNYIAENAGNAMFS